MGVGISHTHRARFVLLFCVAITITLIIAQTWWTIFQDRELTLASERKNGLVAARLLQEHATQTLRDAERELTLAANALLYETAPGEQNEATIRQLLNQHLNDNEALKPLQFADLNGESLINTPGYPPHSTNMRRHAHIEYLLSHPEFRGTIIGRPYPNTYDTEWLLPLARNLFSVSGTHLGLLAVEVRLNYFSAMYSRTAQNNDAIVALFNNKGEIIVRSPFEARYVNRDIAASGAVAQMRLGPIEGSFEDSGTFDDERTRFYIYRKLSGYPLTLVVGRDSATILRAWQDRSRDRILFSAATIALICLLSFILQQHIARLRRTDISLRQSENKFIDLFQHSPLPLALIDHASGRFVEVNHMFLVEFGQARETLLGRSGIETGLWEADAGVDAHRHAAQEVILRHQDGHPILCLLSTREFAIGAQKMLIFAPINITQQRQNELESRELNQQLEQRVQHRTARLQDAHQQLQQALDSLKELQAGLLHSEKMAALGSLVAGVAHELNTPIGNSLTLASTIHEHTNDTLKAIRERKLSRSALERFLEQNEYGGKILARNLQRAAELVSSFKQVAVDQSSNQRREFDLRHTLEELVMTLAPLYAKTPFSMELDLQDGIACESYPGALGQVITNFITNAIKHGFEGRTKGSIQLTCRRLNQGQNQDQVEIVFHDDGIGIAEKHLTRVFDPFYTTKLGQGGSGLGMHIAWNLVTEILGGKIDIQSSPGSGTCLTLILPRIAPTIAPNRQKLL